MKNSSTNRLGIKGDYLINRRNLPFLLSFIIALILGAITASIIPGISTYIGFIFISPVFLIILQKIKYFQKVPEVSNTSKTRNIFHIFLYIFVFALITTIPFYGELIQNLLTKFLE